MSSSEELALPEIAAAEEAVASGKPFGFFSDTHRCYTRSHFKDFRPSASFVFVTNKTDADNAPKLFAKAVVLASGNPTHEDLVSKKYRREEVRKILEVPDDSAIVLIPGNKQLDRNLAVLKAVGIAAKLRFIPVRIFFSRHLGDQNDRTTYANLGYGIEVIEKEKISSLDMLPGVDLIVSGCSPSTDLAGVYHRIPVINYLDETVARHVSGEMSTPIPPLCQEGVTLGVVNLLSLAIVLEAVTLNVLSLPHSELTQLLRYTQEKVYSELPEKGRAVGMMADTLQSILVWR